MYDSKKAEAFNAFFNLTKKVNSDLEMRRTANIWERRAKSQVESEKELGTNTLTWRITVPAIGTPRLFSSSSFSAIRVVSPAYLRLLIFLPAILTSACASSILLDIMWVCGKSGHCVDKPQWTSSSSCQRAFTHLRRTKGAATLDFLKSEGFFCTDRAALIL